MCYDPSARPPLPPIAGGAGIGYSADIVLTALDGTKFGAFTATSADPDAPAVVILPDVRGLHPFYKDLAVRFAEVGVHATAIDYFGRTAGTDERPEEFDFMSHVEQTTPENVTQDVAAAVTHARAPQGGGASRVYIVGFCFGGRASFNQAARGHVLDGVIGLYGRVRGRRGANDDDPPIDLVKEYKCPVLGLFGGADASIPRDDVERFRQTLDEAGITNEIVIYDGAPHSFFDRGFDQHQAACDDAWRRMLRFMDVHP